MTATHIGRSWPGATPIEDACPCPKEPCGLVDREKAHPDCPDHPMERMKSVRQSHSAADCPGTKPAPAPGPVTPRREEYRLPEPQLRQLAENSASGRWVRPLAEEVLGLRARVAELEAGRDIQLIGLRGAMRDVRRILTDLGVTNVPPRLAAALDGLDTPPEGPRG